MRRWRNSLLTLPLFSHTWRRQDIQSSTVAAGASAFWLPARNRPTRLRASTLGEGYGPEEIQAAISGSRRITEATDRKVNLIVDIQAKLREGKGPGYERWAKVFNLKQLAAALAYLQENNLLEYAQLEEKAEAAAGQFHALMDEIKTIEAALTVNRELKAATVKYAKTRPVFEAYKAAGYSRKFLAEQKRSWRSTGPPNLIFSGF